MTDYMKNKDLIKNYHKNGVIMILTESVLMKKKAFEYLMYSYMDDMN